MIDKKQILNDVMQCRQPVRLELIQAKQFCPQAEIVKELTPDIEKFVVRSDSLEKFLKQDIEKIYIEDYNSKKSVEYQMFDVAVTTLHMVVVYCKIRKNTV
jgi:hypothetical protein